MKICDHCGKKNEDNLDLCADCGTLLKVPIETQPDSAQGVSQPQTIPLTVLDARSATIIFLSSFGAEICLAIVFVVAALVMAVFSPYRGEEVQISNSLDKLIPAMTVTCKVVLGVATVLMAFAVIPGQITDSSPTGAAWLRGRWSHLGEGLIIGLIFGALILLLNQVGGHHTHDDDLGPMARMAQRPGFPRIIWVVLVILLAPTSEELLFRGVLYGGYKKSFGHARAAVLTTLIFLLLHFSQIIHSHMAFLGIGGMALLALRSRLRSGAIGPAIAVHTGYNAVISFSIISRFLS